MKLADFLIQYLADRGIDRMFVVSGAANAYIIDAFTRAKRTKYIVMMHEQAAGFAAEGYAKIKKLPGVAIATSGPGGMNLVTPIGNFFYDSVPGLFITGQVNSDFLRPDPALRQVGFQETDIVSIVKPITKYAALVKDPSTIKYELEKALFMAEEGRPGPVLLDIPQNVQKMEIDPAALQGFDAKSARPSYSLTQVDATIDAFLRDLRKAKRPVMLVGGGIFWAGAVELLQKVGRKLKIPMFPTWNALDLVPSDYEYYGGRIGTYGGRGRNFGLQNSDLLLSLASRISGRITGGNVKTFARGAKKYLVDADEALTKKKWQQVPFDESIYCDAKLFLERLEMKLKGVKLPDFSKWTKQVMEWKEKYDPVRPEFYTQKKHVNPYVFIRTLSELMKSNGIFVTDCGGNIVTSNHAFETQNGQRYLTNNGNSPMGFSFAGAMGSWFAAPKRQVVCIIGDGGFNMNLQELQTLRTYGINVKTFIINNHSYGIIKAFQETNVDGRFEASEPQSGYVVPDFMAIAKAYKVRTETVKTNKEIKAKIQKVLASKESVVCDVDCGEWFQYEPRIFGWKTPIEDMYPYLPREEFRKNMFIEPVEGWENPAMPGTHAKKKKIESSE
ncbi:MAG: thiamine pyrophosphate-binding protein [Candidatus Liptonbacteria bacterium]|nr:thiamine pyrophosphate-binding protein [Candidatus Liptonbacteria bacterium]